MEESMTEQTLGDEPSCANRGCETQPMDLSDKAQAPSAAAASASAVEWSAFQCPLTSPSATSPLLKPPKEIFPFRSDPTGGAHSPAGSESSISYGGGADESGSDATSLSSGYNNCGEGMSVLSPMADVSTGNSGAQNQVGTVRLRGIPIVSLMIDGKERLCLAQISNTLLKNFSYNEIHNRRVALGITCVQCTPVQLEILRRYGAMPISSRRCGMITKREAERLVTSFLEQHTPPKLPETFAFDVAHACGWGCRGSFVPARYNSSRAKCIRCSYCQLYLSPNKFIFHFHRTPSSRYHHPDAANFNSWRRHLVLDYASPTEQLVHAWEDVKSMFNGGSRKRLASPTPLTDGSPSSASPGKSAIGSSRHHRGVDSSAVAFGSEMRTAKRQKFHSENAACSPGQGDRSSITSVKLTEPGTTQVIPESSYFGTAARGLTGLCLPSSAYPYPQQFPLSGNSGLTQMPATTPSTAVGQVNQRQLLAAAAAVAGCGTSPYAGNSSSVVIPPPPPSYALPPNIAAAAAAAYYDAAVVKMQMLAAADLWKSVGSRAPRASIDMFWSRSLVPTGNVTASVQQVRGCAGFGTAAAADLKQHQKQRHDPAGRLSTGFVRGNAMGELMPKKALCIERSGNQVPSAVAQQHAVTTSAASATHSATGFKKTFSAFRLIGDSDAELSGGCLPEEAKKPAGERIAFKGTDIDVDDVGKRRQTHSEFDGNANRMCWLEMDTMQSANDVSIPATSTAENTDGRINLLPCYRRETQVITRSIALKGN